MMLFGLSEDNPASIMVQYRTVDGGRTVDVDEYQANENNGKHSREGADMLMHQLEIKTKSVENALLPLIKQINVLVKDPNIQPVATRRTGCTSLRLVGQSVYDAIVKFVHVGKSIAAENSEVFTAMQTACGEVEMAGKVILALTSNDNYGSPACADHNTFEKPVLVKAARSLLSAVTKVLLTADSVSIHQIVNSKQKVVLSLNGLACNLASYADFSKRFAQYGQDMVDFAYQTGERQSDIKSERRKTQLASARTILEKSTLLILLSSKNLLRHRDIVEARNLRDLIFAQVRLSLDQVQNIILDSGYSGGDVITEKLDRTANNFVKIAQETELIAESFRLKCSTADQLEKLNRMCLKLIDFSSWLREASFTSHEQQKLIHCMQCNIRSEMDNLSQALKKLISLQKQTRHEDNRGDYSEARTLEAKRCDENLSCFQASIRDLRKQVEQLTLRQAIDFLGGQCENTILDEIRMFSACGKRDMLKVALSNLLDQKDTVCEMSRLLGQVCAFDQLQVSCEHHELLFTNIFEQIVESSKCLARIRSTANQDCCSAGTDLIDNLTDYWTQQVNEFSILVKDIQDVVEKRAQKTIYLSLPRPGRQGSSSRPKTSMCDNSFSSEGIFSGKGMRSMVTDVENELPDAINDGNKWQNVENDIIKVAKNMSDMAFSMYLFSKSEGSLRTPDDLIHQAGYFAEEGVQLRNLLMNHLNNNHHDLEELMSEIEKLFIFSQQLQVTVKTPIIVGSNVDKVTTIEQVTKIIKDTRSVMNSVNKIMQSQSLKHLKFSASRRWCRFDSSTLATSPFSFAASDYPNTTTTTTTTMATSGVDIHHGSAGRPYESNDESTSYYRERGMAASTAAGTYSSSGRRHRQVSESNCTRYNIVNCINSRLLLPAGATVALRLPSSSPSSSASSRPHVTSSHSPLQPSCGDMATNDGYFTDRV